MINLNERANPLLKSIGISRERVVALCAAMDPENQEIYERTLAKLQIATDNEVEVIQ